MNTPDIIIIATAWLAGLGYAVALGVRLRKKEWSSLAAAWWLFGAVMMGVHVICAFQFRHHWSHEAAEIDTARQTKELMGWEWGGGVWLNYLLVLIWLGDALWLMSAPESYVKRAKWIGWAVQSYLAFMWFNATVVFGSWGAKLFGVVVLWGFWTGRTGEKH
ncbi:MAG: hypothetical protein K0Q55_3920 [Verrucomicrobia bacterium]|nr:hypothetical protein [Verrucomicrobiota bacterium]